jgi:hypothetical protein
MGENRVVAATAVRRKVVVRTVELSDEKLLPGIHPRWRTNIIGLDIDTSGPRFHYCTLSVAPIGHDMCVAEVSGLLRAEAAKAQGIAVPLREGWL